MSNIILQEKVVGIQVKGNVSGKLELTSENIIFKSNDSDFEDQEELIRRIIQVGYRRHFKILPYKFYFRSKSGKMYAFRTFNAKKWSNAIETLIY